MVEQKAEMLSQLGDSTIERLDGAIGAREHHAPFHGYEDECGERVYIGATVHRGFHFEEAFANGLDPSLKVPGDEGVGWRILRVDLEGETTNGAAIPAFCDEDALPVTGENGEDAFEGFRRRSEGRVDDHGTQKFHILFEYGA